MYTRILRLSEPKIAVHGLSAALYEVAAGTKLAADVIAAFTLDATGTTELTTLLTTITGNLAAKAQRVAEIHFILMAAESGLWYTTVATLKARLGV